jgi:hypothetical protein
MTTALNFMFPTTSGGMTYCYHLMTGFAKPFYSLVITTLAPILTLTALRFAHLILRGASPKGINKLTFVFFVVGTGCHDLRQTFITPMVFVTTMPCFICGRD